ncbi:MAG: IS66 family insertion sequence element accessory protein TnpB [Myxococcales bacterium]
MIGRNVAIYVAVTPLDMRRSFDGLAAAARETLRQDPESGALFLFANKRGHRVKILWWDRTGYCLLQKRLEWGAFRLPRTLDANATTVAIDVAELSKILEGVKLPPKKHRMRKQAEEKPSIFKLPR